MTTKPSKRDDVKGPSRFILRWDGKRGGYYVSEPEIDTCEVVRADLYDQLKDELEGTKEALYTEALERDRYRAALMEYAKESPDGPLDHTLALEALHPPTNPIAPGSEVDGGGG